MIETRENFFVLTGGPGSGKSTLVEALRRQGLACVPETGRRIIQTQRRIGGCALPSANPVLYAELELGIGLYAFCEMDASRVTLFDRGILDPIGFLTASNLFVPAYMREAARTYRYNATAFIAPALGGNLRLRRGALAELQSRPRDPRRHGFCLRGSGLSPDAASPGRCRGARRLHSRRNRRDADAVARGVSRLGARGSSARKNLTRFVSQRILRRS